MKVLCALLLIRGSHVSGFLGFTTSNGAPDGKKELIASIEFTSESISKIHTMIGVKKIAVVEGWIERVCEEQTRENSAVMRTGGQ